MKSNYSNNKNKDIKETICNHYKRNCKIECLSVKKYTLVDFATMT